MAMCVMQNIYFRSWSGMFDVQWGIGLVLILRSGNPVRVEQMTCNGKCIYVIREALPNYCH